MLGTVFQEVQLCWGFSRTSLVEIISLERCLDSMFARICFEYGVQEFGFGKPWRYHNICIMTLFRIFSQFEKKLARLGAGVCRPSYTGQRIFSTNPS